MKWHVAIWSPSTISNKCLFQYFTDTKTSVTFFFLITVKFPESQVLKEGKSYWIMVMTNNLHVVSGLFTIIRAWVSYQLLFCYWSSVKLSKFWTLIYNVSLTLDPYRLIHTKLMFQTSKVEVFCTVFIRLLDRVFFSLEWLQIT